MASSSSAIRSCLDGNKLPASQDQTVSEDSRHVCMPCSFFLLHNNVKIANVYFNQVPEDYVYSGKFHSMCCGRQQQWETLGTLYCLYSCLKLELYSIISRGSEKMPGRLLACCNACLMPILLICLRRFIICQIVNVSNEQ